MSTPVCGHCGNRYWRFKSGHPPAGYCSVPCWQARKRKVSKSPPDNAVALVEQIREHRTAAHGDADLIPWYDCEVCDRLETRLAAALT